MTGQPNDPIIPWNRSQLLFNYGAITSCSLWFSLPPGARQIWFLPHMTSTTCHKTYRTLLPRLHSSSWLIPLEFPPPQPYPTWGGSLLRPYYNKIQLYVEHVGEGGWGCYGCDVRGSITVAGRILQTCRIRKTEKLLSRLISWFTERAIPDNSFFFCVIKTMWRSSSFDSFHFVEIVSIVTTCDKVQVLLLFLWIRKATTLSRHN